MTIRSLLRAGVFMALATAGTFFAAQANAQEVIRLRIASGHPPVNTYVNPVVSG